MHVCRKYKCPECAKPTPYEGVCVRCEDGKVMVTITLRYSVVRDFVEEAQNGLVKPYTHDRCPATAALCAALSGVYPEYPEG